MTDKKKILFDLLDRKSLSAEEKEQLKLLLEDEELRSLYNLYTSAFRALKKGRHLSIDELRDYILIKNNLDPEDRSLISKMNFVEDHLRNCSICFEESAFLNSQFNDIEVHVANELKPKAAPSFFYTVSGKISWARPAAYIIIIIGFVYLLAFAVSGLTTSPAHKYVSEHNEAYYGARGRVSDEFQKSTAALEDGNYEIAISSLEQDVKTHPSDETIFYSYYILGITYLDASGSDILGLFPRYDSRMTDKGIENLKTALDKNTSGNFDNISSDIYFQLGRAYLMKDDPGTAKKYLNLVIERKGGRMSESREILNGLAE